MVKAIKKSIIVPNDLLKEIEAIAIRENRSFSNACVTILQNFFEDNEQQDK